ncbi:MAG: hypothetical protein WBM86_03850 [Waterburya sp.]
MPKEAVVIATAIAKICFLKSKLMNRVTTTLFFVMSRRVNSPQPTDQNYTPFKSGKQLQPVWLKVKLS